MSQPADFTTGGGGGGGGEEQEVSVTEQVSEEASTSTEDKPRKRRTSRHSTLQQLVVQTVSPQGTVECQLLCKQKTISFKFNRFDTSPSDIVGGLVKEELIKEGNHRVFTDQLKDVIRQLKEHPEKVPVVYTPYVQKVGGGGLCGRVGGFYLYWFLCTLQKVRHASLTRHTQRKTHRRHKSVSCLQS